MFLYFKTTPAMGGRSPFDFSTEEVNGEVALRVQKLITE